jgi:hypothetical protein
LFWFLGLRFVVGFFFAGERCQRIKPYQPEPKTATAQRPPPPKAPQQQQQQQQQQRQQQQRAPPFLPQQQRSAPVVAMCGQRCGLDMTATTAMPDAVRTGLALRRGSSAARCSSGTLVFGFFV